MTPSRPLIRDDAIADNCEAVCQPGPVARRLVKRAGEEGANVCGQGAGLLRWAGLVHGDERRPNGLSSGQRVLTSLGFGVEAHPPPERAQYLRALSARAARAAG
jgi:hypothetical protein